MGVDYEVKKVRKGWFAKNSEVIMALSTIMLVAATVVNIFLVKSTIHEMRNQTKIMQDSFKPIQRAYFQIETAVEYFPGDFEKREFLDSIYVYTTFENIGQTPAYAKLVVHGAEKYNIEVVNTLDSLRHYSVTDIRKPAGHIDYNFTNFFPPRSRFTSVDTMRLVPIHEDNSFYFHLTFIYEDVFNDWHILYQITPFQWAGYKHPYEAGSPNIKQEKLIGDFKKYIEFLADIKGKSNK